MIVNINKTRRRDHTLAGLGALYDTSPINPTTIWTPSTGFLATPGNVNSGTVFGGPTSVYDVPGLLLAAPDCTQAAGGAFVSAACVDQALAVQQTNFQRTADFNAGKQVTGVVNSNPPPVPPSTPTPTSTNNQVNKQAPVSQATIMANTSGGIVDISSIMPSLSGNVSIAGYSIPIWAVALVVGGGLFIFAGKH
jgi:hypothetical protein